jgi:hypothetical protein
MKDAMPPIPDGNPDHPYSADPEVRALAEELINRAGRTFPFPGALDLLIAEDIARAVINSDWRAKDLEVFRNDRRRLMKAIMTLADDAPRWIYPRSSAGLDGYLIIAIMKDERS